MTKEELKEQLVALAQAVGAMADETAAKGHAWGKANTMQKFMMMHPMALYVFKTIIDDDECIAFCREKLADKDTINAIYRLDDERKHSMTGAEEQKELIDRLDAALTAAGMGLRLSDCASSDPYRIARSEVFEQLKELVWKMRYAQCKKLNVNNKPLLYQEGRRVGSYVRVRPCGKEYEGKTYLGIYLGDFPLGASFSQDENDKDALNINFSLNNPAIYIPEVKRTVFGCESWWGEIEKPEDLKEISNADIEDVWYVKAMKEMSKEVEN